MRRFMYFNQLKTLYNEDDLKKTENLIREAATLAQELDITLRVMPVKAYQKFQSASKV